jgi:hypothetical protein
LGLRGLRTIIRPEGDHLQTDHATPLTPDRYRDIFCAAESGKVGGENRVKISPLGGDERTEHGVSGGSGGSPAVSLNRSALPWRERVLSR